MSTALLFLPLVTVIVGVAIVLSLARRQDRLEP